MDDLDWIKDIMEIEDFIINLISGCDKESNDCGYYYKKNDILYFHQYDSIKTFFFDWDYVYEPLESKFGLNISEQEYIIKNVIRYHHNLNNFNVMIQRCL